MLRSDSKREKTLLRARILAAPMMDRPQSPIGGYTGVPILLRSMPHWSAMGRLPRLLGTRRTQSDEAGYNC